MAQTCLVTFAIIFTLMVGVLGGVVAYWQHEVWLRPLLLPLPLIDRRAALPSCHSTPAAVPSNFVELWPLSSGHF